MKANIKYVDKTTTFIKRHLNADKFTADDFWIARGSLHGDAIDLIFNCVPTGSTILELGSGISSDIFAKHGYNVYAVEDNPKWLNKYEKVNYIHAPIKEYETDFGTTEKWYDLDKSMLPSNYDLIIIDGPDLNTPFCRYGFAQHIALFNKCSVLFDDIHVPNNYMMMIETMNRWSINNVKLYNAPYDKAYAVC